MKKCKHLKNTLKKENETPPIKPTKINNKK